MPEWGEEWQQINTNNEFSLPNKAVDAGWWLMTRMKVKLFLDFTALAIYLVDDCCTEHKIVPQYYIMIGFMAGEVP